MLPLKPNIWVHFFTKSWNRTIIWTEFLEKSQWLLDLPNTFRDFHQQLHICCIMVKNWLKQSTNQFAQNVVCLELTFSYGFKEDDLIWYQKKSKNLQNLHKLPYRHTCQIINSWMERKMRNGILVGLNFGNGLLFWYIDGLKKKYLGWN